MFFFSINNSNILPFSFPIHNSVQVYRNLSVGLDPKIKPEATLSKKKKKNPDTTLGKILERNETCMETHSLLGDNG